MQLTKFIPADREDIFDAFIKPERIEQWAYPDGMTLKVPELEAREGGHYRYVHSNKDGEFNCVGHFKEIVPNEKIVTLDEKITGPDGNVLYENLLGTVSFRDKTGGTELTVSQSGFTDKNAEKECEQGWVDSLNHLTELVRKDSGPRAESEYSASL